MGLKNPPAVVISKNPETGEDAGGSPVGESLLGFAVGAGEASGGSARGRGLWWAGASSDKYLLRRGGRARGNCWGSF